MKNQKDIQSLELAIKIVGGSSALAALIGVATSLPSMWKRRGQIPIANCLAIERATNGAVTRRDLRPNDWQDIWPELAQPTTQEV